MRTRAAVALEAGKPLEIMEVNLDGPKAGRGPDRGKSHRPVPHRRSLPGRVPTPKGCSRQSWAMKVRGRRAGGWRGRDHAETGRPRNPALHAGMPRVPRLPVRQDQPLHRDPGHAGSRP